MKKSMFSVAVALCLSTLSAVAQPPLENYFAPASKEAAAPDAEGFIRRWTLLEPISKPNRTNAVFTDSYLRKNFAFEYFKDQFTILPKDGQKVKAKVQVEVRDKKPNPARPMGGWRMEPPKLKDAVQTLTWHKYDSKLYNTKLFRFASGLKKPVYGVIFWAVTEIECDKELKDVRLAVGSNSASMWWLNGEEALLLSGDRRMVADDCTSTRLTLKKGKNVLRGAIINGPGMSDFCVRFLDENGQPVKGIKII